MKDIFENYGGCAIAIVAAWITIAVLIAWHKQSNANETVNSENVVEPDIETESQSQPVFVYETDDIVAIVGV